MCNAFVALLDAVSPDGTARIDNAIPLILGAQSALASLLEKRGAFSNYNTLYSLVHTAREDEMNSFF